MYICYQLLVLTCNEIYENNKPFKSQHGFKCFIQHDRNIFRYTNQRCLRTFCISDLCFFRSYYQTVARNLVLAHIQLFIFATYN